MRFFSLVSDGIDQETLKNEYRSGREIGKICLGENLLFFKSNFKVYYIPYSDIYRYFRRVMMVPARLCCGRMNLEIENLVICDKDKELAQIQLPGNKAAKAVMEILSQRAPEAIVGYPKKKEEKVAGKGH